MSNLNEIVEMYVKRDEEIGHNGINFLTKHLEKLGYTPEKIIDFRENVKKNFYKKLIDEFDFNKLKNMEEFWLNSLEFYKLEHSVNSKEDRYNYLKNFLDSSNEDFYKQLNHDELIYLGW